MDFELHFILIVGAALMNLVFCGFSAVGFFMVKESLKDLDDDMSGVLMLFGCIFVIASFGFQCFILANWLKSFY